jgi:broad specificity phosphatase PhoE
MVEVWYIRHGESQSNVGYVTDSQDAIQLTETGRAQAHKTSFAFNKAPTLIVTSRYARAAQTAQYTIDRFPNVPVETWDVHEFTYLPPALPHSKLYWELAEAYWDRSDPAYIHGEGAESFQDFIGRVKTLEERINVMDDQFIVIFSHGYVINMILWANQLGSWGTIATTMSDFYAFEKSFEIPNCAIVKAEYHADKTLFSGLLTKHLR